MKLVIVWILKMLSFSGEIAEGLVCTLKETQVGEVSIRLESNTVFLKSIETQTGNLVYTQFNANQIQYVTLCENNIKVTYKSVKINGFNEKILLKSLAEGSKMSLYFRKGLKLNPYDDVVLPDLFIEKIGHNAIPVDSKKVLLDALSDHENSIKYFMKSNAVTYNSSEDLIKLINYYNEL